MKSSLLYKFISITLALVIVFGCFSFSFADDDVVSSDSSDLTSESSALPDSALLSTVSDEHAISIDNDLRSIAVSLGAQAAADTGCDCGTAVNNIYQLLILLYGYNSNTYGWWVHDKDTHSLLSTSNSYLQSITDYLGNSNYGVIQSLDNLESSLNYIKSQLETNDGNTITDVASWLMFIQQSLNNFSNNFTSYSTIVDNDLDLLLYGLNNYYSTNHSDLQSALTALNNFKSANHTDIENLRTDYNTLVPIASYDNLMEFYIDDVLVSGQGFVGKTITCKMPNLPTLNQNVSLWIFKIPFRLLNYTQSIDNVISDVKFYNSFGQLFDVDYKIMSYSNQIWIFVYNGSMYHYNPQSMYFTFDVIGALQRNNSINNISLFDISQLDFYTLYNYLDSFEKNKLLEYNNSQLDDLDSIANTFKDLYASDDLIAAKQAQQSVENASIADFTGSGSAAANVGNVTDAKGIQNTIKSGLNTGGSVSNGLSIFNNDSSFWGWFSSDCASWFTTEDQSRSLMISPVYNPEDNTLITTLPDIVGERDNEYYNLLGGEVR